MLERFANTGEEVRNVASDPVDETGDKVEESFSGLVEACSREGGRIGLEPGVELLFAALLVALGAWELACPGVDVPVRDVLNVDKRAGRFTEGYLGVVEEEIDGGCYLDSNCEVGLGKISSSDSPVCWRWCVW